MFGAVSGFSPSRKCAAEALTPVAKRSDAPSEEESEDEDSATLLAMTLAEPNLKHSYSEGTRYAKEPM